MEGSAGTTGRAAGGIISCWPTFVLDFQFALLARFSRLCLFRIF